MLPLLLPYCCQAPTGALGLFLWRLPQCRASFGQRSITMYMTLAGIRVITIDKTFTNIPPPISKPCYGLKCSDSRGRTAGKSNAVHSRYGLMNIPRIRHIYNSSVG
jgi:hypothetical protein